MPIRAGINGFGRIGRNVFRVLCERKNIEVVCINDITDAKTLAHLLKYDTVMGRFDGEVSTEGENLRINGKVIKVTAKKDPGEIPWKQMGADYVIESTGLFTSRAEVEKHVTGGARKVILTVPPKDELDALVVLGVNEDTLRPEHKLISNASCTTNCLAPLVKVIDDAF